MPPVRILLGVVVVGALAAGCGKSGHQFIENEDAGVFAKLPDDWMVFDERDLFEAQEGSITDIQAENLSSRVWFRGFDATEDPDVTATSQLSSMNSSEPRGFVTIQQLTPAQREQVNLSLIRGFFAGVDPLTAMQEQPDGPFEVISDEPVEFEGGYHGLHTVFAADGDEGTSLVDQTALLNSTSSAVYLFVIGCNEECFLETYKDDINDIVDSWTIQENGA